MKICVSCHQHFISADWKCPFCSYTPTYINEFIAFAPELANENEGFEASYFADLFDLEANHFWFQSRNKLINWAIQKYFPNANSFLEIGCGTGFVLSGIQQDFPQLALSGSEIFSNGLTFAKQRNPNVQLFQMDARQIPFFNEFEIIGAFDVLEHIQEDTLVLREMYQATMKGGGIVITVPQHPWLWSYADEYAHHVRRYQANELKKKVQEAGFQVVRMTSFVSLLLPLMVLSRLKRQKTNLGALSEFKISQVTNYLLETIMNMERGLIRSGLALVVGGSLLVVAKKI